MRFPFGYFVTILQLWIKDVNGTAKDISTVETVYGEPSTRSHFIWTNTVFNGRELVEDPDSIVNCLWPQTAVGQSTLPTLWGLGRTSTERRNGVGF